MQLRLHENCIFVNDKFCKLDDYCRFCGDPESLEHIASICPAYGRLRNKYLLKCPDGDNIFTYPKDAIKCKKKYRVFKIFSQCLSEIGTD